jgi:exonuclease III
MWTHRNGNSPGAAVQHLDFIFASRQMVRELRQVTGGVRDFPDSWDVSDHAPVVAAFARG